MISYIAFPPHYNYFRHTDPDLKWNTERGHYDFGEMDWDEFWSVVNGNGPCNKQRLAHHKKAHDEGKWVRDAAKAHAKKQELVAN